jgi:diaminopimelate decarboxylase
MAVSQGLNQKKVSMIPSAVILSALSATTSHSGGAARRFAFLHGYRIQAPSDDIGSPVEAFPDPERTALHRCDVYRRSFPMTEIAFPAGALRNRIVAKWIRDQRVTVDVRNGEDLASAIAAGIHPARMTVHAEGLSDSDLRATTRLGVGRVVVGSIPQTEMLASAADRATQDVVIRMTDANASALALADGSDSVRRGLEFDTKEVDLAIRTILADDRLNLVGLHCEVGARAHDFVSYPAAIGQTIAEMTQIRRRYALVLTRLGLGGGRAVPSGDWDVDLPQLASQIDSSLDDACATLHFPRPLVAVSAGLTYLDRSAA